MSPKTLRRTLWGAVVVLCLFVGATAGVTIMRASGQAPLPGVSPTLAASFLLSTTKGDAVNGVTFGVSR